MLSLEVWDGLGVGIVDAENSVSHLEKSLAGSAHKHLQYIVVLFPSEMTGWFQPWWSLVEFLRPHLCPLWAWSPRRTECHPWWARLELTAPPTGLSQTWKQIKGVFPSLPLLAYFSCFYDEISKRALACFKYSHFLISLRCVHHTTGLSLLLK